MGGGGGNLDSKNSATFTKFLTIIFLSLCFLNPASITNTLFIRPYALQELAFLVFIYVFICVFYSFRDFSESFSDFKAKSILVIFLDSIKNSFKSKFIRYFIIVWSLFILIFISFVFYIDKFKSNDEFSASLRLQELLLPKNTSDTSPLFSPKAFINDLHSQLKKQNKNLDSIKIRAKIMFNSPIFRAQNPFVSLTNYNIILDSNVEKFIESNNFTFEKNKQKYVIFSLKKLENLKDYNTESLKSELVYLMQNLQKISIGTISYKIHINYKLYLLILALYIAAILLFLVFFIIFISIYRILKVINDKAYNKNLCYIVLSSSFLMLSGYFAVIFVCLVYAFHTLFMFFKNYDFKYKIFYFIAFLLTLLLNAIMYKRYYTAFFDYRGVEASSKISFAYLSENLLDISQSFYHILLNNLGYSYIFAILLVTILVIFFKKDSKIYNVGNSISLLSFLWSFLVMILAPYKTLRYIMAIFPLLILWLPICLNILGQKGLNFRILSGTIALICALNCIYLSTQKGSIENLNAGYKDSIIAFENAANKGYITYIIPEYAQNIIPYLSGQHYVIMSGTYFYCDKLDSLFRQKVGNYIIEKGAMCKLYDETANFTLDMTTDSKSSSASKQKFSEISIEPKDFSQEFRDLYYVINSDSFYFLTPF